MDYQALKTELTTDPLTRGYSTMSDLEAANDLNTVYRTRNVTAFSATEVLQAVDATEYAALEAAEKDVFWGLMGMGTLNPWGVEASIFTQLFGGGSQTISDLQDMRVENISRADELGLGIVNEGDVNKARAL